MIKIKKIKKEKKVKTSVHSQESKEESKESKESKEESKEESKLIQLIKSLKINKLAYISVLVSAFFLYKTKKGSNFITIICSFCFTGYLSYEVHKSSHTIHCKELFDNNISLIENNVVNKCLRTIASVFDFHSIIHHDTSINKQPINMIYEFISNFIGQGVIPYLTIESIKQFDTRACFVWGLTYASVHNINYYYLKPKTHEQHHINPNTNYGLDIFDIIFGTKYDTNEIEDINHMSFNLLLSVVIVLYLNKLREKFK